MRKATKVFVIAGIVIVFFILSGINLEIRKSNGFHTPGPINTILLLGMIAAIAAVAKYNIKSDDKKIDSTNNQSLDKS